MVEDGVCAEFALGDDVAREEKDPGGGGSVAGCLRCGVSADESLAGRRLGSPSPCSWWPRSRRVVISVGGMVWVWSVSTCSRCMTHSSPSCLAVVYIPSPLVRRDSQSHLAPSTPNLPAASGILVSLSATAISSVLWRATRMLRGHLWGR